MKIVLSVLMVLWSVLSCAATPFENKPLEAQIEALFAPGRNVLDVKLEVDRLVGGTAHIRPEIDRMAERLASMAANAQTSHDKLKVLRRFIYEAGDWNDNRPFAYDLSDPLGTLPANRHLAGYLETRRGNCVTMPILFVILGQRIGLDLTFALAPLHVLVKYIDDDGAQWNLEPTSGGGFTRDVWYRQELPMSDEAVAKGTYLKALNTEETAALIASFLVEHLMATGKPEDAIVAADVMLKHYPGFAYLHIKRGSAYYLILKRDVIDPSASTPVPPALKATADQLYAQNQAAFQTAESLGWRETDGQK